MNIARLHHGGILCSEDVKESIRNIDVKNVYVYINILCSYIDVDRDV